MMTVTAAHWLRLSLAGLLALQLATSSEAVERVPRPSESGFAQVDGISLFYQIYGSGEPILLIHGGLSDGEVWRRQLAALSENHRVIVADSRGQGRSTRDETPITYDLMADDYLALLDQLGESSVALVGWSDGGIIGLDIAIRHPERLTRMFIQAANVTPDGALAHDPTKDVPELKHYESISEEIEALWANEPNFTREQLSSIPVPTEIAIGEHDETISRDHTLFIANTIPGARFVLLPQVGHSAPVEDPKGYAQAVLRFIDGTG
ncbi:MULTISPECIES: alpha/beta fold hydrolase [unclassified Aureimonas]|uniref:alpha/beta fold hydrolase n=1 Tax=unclassified Aureimonas TaxID=2615206 RepID=UPI0006FCB455|nr:MULTISPECIES: alpha/beta hydrolase [unclassified Aureimonas]KQT52934.1 esterase [Aureimonas sp. Leaf427]KQT80393.1 esterase [Aureimonas sp. Leaf460]